MSFDMVWSRARAHFDEGVYDEALPLLNQAVQVKPEHPEANFWLALCLARLERWDESEIHLRRCLQLSIPQPSVKMALAACWRKQGKFRIAEAALHQLPAGPDVWLELGRVCRATARLSESLEWLQRCGDCPDALAERAEVHEMLDEPEPARECWLRSGLPRAQQRIQSLSGGLREKVVAHQGSILLGWSYDEGLHVPEYWFLNATVADVADCLSRFLGLWRVFAWPLAGVVALEAAAQPLAIALSQAMNLPLGEPESMPQDSMLLGVWLEAPVLAQGPVPQGPDRRWLTLALSVPDQNRIVPDLCAVLCRVSVPWSPGDDWWAGIAMSPTGELRETLKAPVSSSASELADELLEGLGDCVESLAIAEFYLDQPLRSALSPAPGARSRLAKPSALQARHWLAEGDPTWAFELGLFDEESSALALEAWPARPKQRWALARFLERCPGRTLWTLWERGVGRELLVGFGLWEAGLQSDSIELRELSLRAATMPDKKVDVAHLAGLEHLPECVPLYVRSQGKAALDWLLARLESPHLGVVYEALRALPRVGSPQLAPRIEPYLTHEDIGIVKAAARCLRRWGVTKGVTALLGSQCPKLRACAAANLSDGPVLTLALEQEQTVSVQRALVASLTRCGYAPAGELVRGLAASAPKLLEVSLEYLERNGVRPSDQDLLLLAMRYHPSQALAALLLWRLGLGEFRQALVDLVRSQHHLVASVLLRGGQDCVELLLQAWSVRPDLVDRNLWAWRKSYGPQLRQACRARPKEAGVVREIIRGLARQSEDPSKAKQMLRQFKLGLRSEPGAV